MSRIGRLPIVLDKEVKVQVSAQNVVVLEKGQKSLKVPVRSEIEVHIEDGKIILKRKNELPKTKAFHGLYRALLNNAVLGLTQGWKKSLKLNGVGYKASVSGQKLDLNLGFSHPLSLALPEGVQVTVEKQTTLHITGQDKQKVSQMAAKIRSFRPPEPYLGKGVRYLDEVIRKKAGKSGAEKK